MFLIVIACIVSFMAGGAAGLLVASLLASRGRRAPWYDEADVPLEAPPAYLTSDAAAPKPQD